MAADCTAFRDSRLVWEGAGGAMGRARSVYVIIMCQLREKVVGEIVLAVFFGNCGLQSRDWSQILPVKKVWRGD